MSEDIFATIKGKLNNLVDTFRFQVRCHLFKKKQPRQQLYASEHWHYAKRVSLSYRCKEEKQGSTRAIVHGEQLQQAY